MKTVLAICVISCLLTVGYAINIGNIASCVTGVENVACVARLPNAITNNSFCADCANCLIGYYRRCTGRNDIDSLLEGENQSYIDDRLNLGLGLI